LATVGESQIAAAPTLLPGGRAVLFGLIEGASERVAVLDLETGEQKIVVDGGQNPTYVPTGHIVFARGTTLMAVPFSVSELAATGEPVAMLQGVRHPGSQTAADFALSATGTLVYVPGDEASGGAGFSVVWVDRTGRVTARAIDEPIEIARDPRLSPDGERLVLTTGAVSTGSVWVYDLRGRPPIPLAVGNDNRAGVWSPDGKQIAFLKAPTNVGGVYVTRADGSVPNPQPLRAQAVHAMPFAWSSAGELLVITPPIGATGSDIYATPAAEEGDVREIVGTGDNEIDPALSPNGRWLAYASDRTGDSEIWVKGYPDGVAVRVSRNGGFEPRWSGDGREIFFLQGNTMMAVTVETADDFSFAPPVELFSGNFFTIPGLAMRTYDVAPDGRFLMIQTTGSTGDNAQLGSIVVVQNWVEELKQRVPPRR
jgi:serine/threonine-protein kinase